MKKDVKKQIWIQIKGENIQVERKKIKNLYLRISPADGTIRISAPERMPMKSIEDFVIEKWDWILTTRGHLDRVRREKDVGQQLTEDERKAQKEAYKRKLSEVLPQVIPKCESARGLHALEWKLRDMKTRWGTCNTRTGKLWFALMLARQPRECVEYVVLHELAHLYEPSHNARFKAFLDLHMPEWREIRKQMR